MVVLCILIIFVLMMHPSKYKNQIRYNGDSNRPGIIGRKSFDKTLVKF